MHITTLYLFSKRVIYATKGLISPRNSLLQQMSKYGHVLGDAHPLMIVIMSQCLMLRQCLDFRLSNCFICS